MDVFFGFSFTFLHTNFFKLIQFYDFIASFVARRIGYKNVPNLFKIVLFVKCY
jgi:hypothetical protein